jgi:outer membrane protein insertion porin family
MRIPRSRIPAFAAAGAFVLSCGVVLHAGSSTAEAQQPAPQSPPSAAVPDPTPDPSGRCATPDSIVVRGLNRVTESTALGDIGLPARSELATPQVQGAVKRLYATGQFEDVQVSCDLAPGGTRAALVFTVRERPLLADVDVVGAKQQDGDALRSKVDLLIGQPLDPAKVARAVQRMDSVYQSKGFYLARIRPDSTRTSDGRVSLRFRVDEGRHLAVSGVRINGNRAIGDETVVAAMKTRPEGFFWWRRGAFDEEQYQGDLSERLPELYGRRGYIDFQILKDTLIIDRERGKAFVDITVSEGPQYKVGSFEILENRRFSSDELQRFYPFTGQGPTLTQRLTRAARGQFRGPAKDVFDRTQWDAATEKVQGAYRNEGYIYARISPTLERTRVGPDSQPAVNLRWQIEERTPAIVNRIDIAGNDYTSDECIRRQLVLVPGDVFNQDRLLRSWQSIGNLGFFDTPLPFPDTRPANEQGDLDVIFRVKEKRTGSFNFGASMGGAGVGVGGFIGVDQPNLFGQCKRGSLNWNFGRFFNDFVTTYTDPAIKKSRVSGTLSAYRRQSRFFIQGFGQNVTTGASARLGFPVPGSYFTTLGLTYTADAITLRNVDSTFSIGGTCTRNCFRSSLGVDLTHDTRIGLPFASAGGLQTISADFNGGILGGTQNFQRVTGDFRAYTTIGQFGGRNPGSQPKQFVVGLQTRGGFLFGDPGAFFLQQGFAVGGVQFGQSLRGYPEFSITPRGFDPRAEQFSATSGRGAFGNAYFTTTAEMGLRFNQQLYLNVFYDAGNNFARAVEFNPTRLFRGAGVGVSVVTPLGPLGLDWAYGFDRRALIDPANPLRGTRPDPRFQLHFRLGQMMF